MSVLARAQTNEWTWIGGSSTVPLIPPVWPYGQPGVYGMRGMADAANIPGGRYLSTSWIDNNGNLWLFGGDGFDSTHTFGYLNDLWEFNVTTREWTWIGGSSTIPSSGGQPGVYGVMLTPGAGNAPGSRDAAAGWTDAHGNLWLFGGSGFDAAGSSVNLNDLWEYNVISGEWTWMGGSSTVGSAGSVAGVYGVEGSLTSGSYPGSHNPSATWTDNDGNLWMFGGYAADSLNHSGDMNDLWKFNPTTLQWAWMNGSSTVNGPGTAGVYGMEYSAEPGNTPGSRENSAGWIDTGGNLWLFGGAEYVPTTSGVDAYAYFNDVWEYTPSNNEWAWMGGSTPSQLNCNPALNPDCGAPGVYGMLGTPSLANIPGGRASPMVWLDSGNIWMFGGEGYDSTGDTRVLLDDLWEFNPSANEWTWQGGPSKVSVTGPPGVYGMLDVGNPANTPGGRFIASSWTGLDGNFWLLGGGGLDADGNLGYLNDMWLYGTATFTTLPPPNFSLPSGTYPPVQTVSLSDTISGATIYYTTNGTTPSTSSAVYTGPIAVSTSQTIEAYAAAGGFVPSATSSASYTINIPTPSFTLGLSQYALTINSGANGSTMATVTPLNGFNSMVSLSCSGLPSGATCNFSPASVTPSGNPVGAQLTITVPAQAQLERKGNPWLPGSTLAFATCFLICRRRKNWRLSAVLFVVFLGAGILSGCGQLLTETIPSNSTVTVTATSATMQQSAQLSLTVN